MDNSQNARKYSLFLWTVIKKYANKNSEAFKKSVHIKKNCDITKVKSLKPFQMCVVLHKIYIFFAINWFNVKNI